jgi:hypothetical protein
VKIIDSEYRIGFLLSLNLLLPLVGSLFFFFFLGFLLYSLLILLNIIPQLEAYFT